MKCARGERVDGNINGLAYPYGTDNRIGHSNDNLDGVGFGERNAGTPGPTNAPGSTAFFTMSPSKGAIREVSRRAISASLVRARADFSCSWLAWYCARAESKSGFLRLWVS